MKRQKKSRLAGYTATEVYRLPFSSWDGFDNPEALRWNKHYEQVIKPKLEARELAKSKRPPLDWNETEKPLKFKVVLYYKGKREDFIGYSLTQGWFQRKTFEVVNGPFIVKRID